MLASGTATETRAPWYSEEAGFFGTRYLEEYASWMTSAITEAQVSFLAQVLGCRSPATILDLACGNGRHSIGLAGRGFSLTGLDINESLLSRARIEAEAGPGSPDWVRADMRQIPFEETFDGVVSVFTSFGFFEDEDDNAQVIEQVARTLRPGGVFMLDLMNKDFVLSRFREVEERRGSDGKLRTHHRSFDTATHRFHHERISGGESGDVERWETVVRLYAPDELQGLLAESGLRVTDAYGGYRFESFEQDQPRMILLAEKQR
jgi:SAM-dependent methyltransferase